MQALLAVTIGASFFFLPLVCYLSTVTFFALYVRRADVAEMSWGERWEQLRPIVRDPIRVATLLFLSGVAVTVMIGGSFRLAEYADAPITTLEVVAESFTNWNDPLSSRAIAVRGGVFIVLLCCAGVTVALVSYFRNRWASLENQLDRATD